MAKVVVTGAAGMLGTSVIDTLAERHQVIATSRTLGYQRPGVRWRLLDLTDEADLRGLLTTERPDLVIHAAAVVNVEECERHPDQAARVHVGATKVIVDELRGWSGALMYISTDSVYGGEKDGPYEEGDRTSPLNAYARTKLEGEVESLRLEKATVLRTNIFGWSRADRLSFAEWVLKGLVEGSELGMFRDVSYTPIHVRHLAGLIEPIWRGGVTGILHAGGATALSKLDFAVLMADEFGHPKDGIRPRDLEDAAFSARRPRNTALSSARLAGLIGGPLPGVLDGIRLMKEEFDSGWVAAVKGRRIGSGYRFWEES